MIFIYNPIVLSKTGIIYSFISFTQSAKEYHLVDDSVQYTEVGNRKTPYTTVVAFEGNTDIMEERTVELFLETTHERYRRCFGNDFGTHMTMMFTDEPRPGCPAWFSGIEKRFYEKYGYDILDHLPALY